MLPGTTHDIFLAVVIKKSRTQQAWFGGTELGLEPGKGEFLSLDFKTSKQNLYDWRNPLNWAIKNIVWLKKSQIILIAEPVP